MESCKVMNRFAVLSFGVDTSIIQFICGVTTVLLTIEVDIGLTVC